MLTLCWMQIFIPDDKPVSADKGYDLATADERDVARKRATVQVRGSEQQGTPQREEEQLPEWWNPTPALHVSLFYKEEVGALTLTCTIHVWCHRGTETSVKQPMSAPSYSSATRRPASLVWMDSSGARERLGCSLENEKSSLRCPAIKAANSANGRCVNPKSPEVSD